jgi:deazaflavin-dependent oxidoreductase (nitroreductase family)
MSIRRRLARFNRVFANRLLGPALPALPGFGAVLHRGRRSGRPYRTPVMVFRSGELYVFALPYGSDSDWVKNVLAAGGCDLRTRGRSVRLVEPTVDENDSQSDIPFVLRWALKRLSATEFMTLKPAGADRDPRRHQGEAT